MAWIMPIFVALSTFGAVNGILLTTSRLFFAGAREKQMPEILTMIQINKVTPVPAVICIAFLSLLYLIVADIYTLINYVGFATWLSIGVAVLCLPVLRYTQPDLARPIKVNLFFPIAYIIASCLITVVPMLAKPVETGYGCLMIASSIPTYLIFIMWKKKPKLFDEFIGMFDANSIRLHGLGQETALLRIFFIFSIQAPRSQLGAIGGIEGLLVCMGNPLLDISVYDDGSLLKKYDLKSNNAILAEEKHKPLYKDIVDNFDVEYTAGGASQNTARIVQKILKVPNVVVYMGCVGRDSYSEIIEKKAREDGVNVCYQFTTEEPTGTCAVIISNEGKDRSLCANLAASTKFSIEHVRRTENAGLIKKADYYYVTGFFLIVSPNSALEVAKTALENQKLFIMNISAPYICHTFNEHLSSLLPYVDILFGNETEAEAFSEVYEFGTKDVKKIALKISQLPKINPERKRLVVITQGHLPVVVARDNTVKEFPITRLPPEKIVDTNGAGDAFVGGFLAQLIQDQPYDICVECGNWAASEVIQNSGCIFNRSEPFCPSSTSQLQQ
ncbi:hypothetical protein V9T40_004741 [Parthenolecanium corni]|uniref:adenosine kinase n=1 Tax=Parthenolecanium corni TaxID=536013 RepID=A0AAN9TGT5_9HEMI